MTSFIDRLNAYAKDYAREQVPENQTRTTLDIISVWSAAFISVPVMMMGFQVGGFLAFDKALIAILLGQGVLAAIFCLAGYIGAKLRLSTAMILKSTFGRIGGDIPSFLIALSTLGWFGFQTEIFGTGLGSMIETLFGVTVPMPALILCGGILMSTTAILGFKAVSFLSHLSIPFLILLLVVPFFNLIQDQDLSVLWANPPDVQKSIGTGVSIIIGGIIVGAIISPDFNRYSDSPKNAVVANSVVNLIIAPILLVFSMFLVAASGETDFVKMMYKAGWGLPAMATLVLATWTTNDTNLYVSSLSLASLFKKFAKWQIAAACGLLATIVALVGVVEYFVPWLLLTGVTFAPAAGVYITDYFLRADQYVSKDFDALPAFRKRPFISWTLGSLIGFLVTPGPEGGFGLMEVSGIPAVDALLAAALIHFTLMKFTPGKTQE